MRILALIPLLGALALGACRGQTSEESPVALLRNMYQQPRYIPQAKSLWFDDGRTMRTPPAGTIAREMTIDKELAEGRLADDSGYVDQIPGGVVRRAGGMAAMLERGRERYGIYCGLCHDGTGAGEGMVIQRAANPAFKPPSLHQARLREMPDGELFAVISHGKNNMPAYGPIVPAEDRWSIVAYVRALQLSMAAQDSGAGQ